MRPNLSRAARTSSSLYSRSATSPATASASEPPRSISSTAAFSPSSPRAPTTTFAPRCPAARATARPTPLDAPVTTITCSCSGFLRTGRSYPDGEALRFGYAGSRHCRVDRDSDRRAARIRAEEAARDRPLARTRHARVQGVGLGPRREGRAAAAVGERNSAPVVLDLTPWLGFRGAPPAFDRARRRLRDGTRPRRDRVRLLGRAAAGDALPDELRLRPLPDPRQGARLLPVRLLRAARGRACIRGACVRTGARPSENPDRGEAAQHLAHGSLRDDRGRRPPPRRRSRLDDPLGDPARRALPALDRACHVP